jgi:hypothetical protein
VLVVVLDVLVVVAIVSSNLVQAAVVPLVLTWIYNLPE